MTAPPVRSGHPSARQAETRALRIAQETAAHVPAYARHLRLTGYDPSRLRSIADFRDLPVVDKASYLARYPLDQRCRRGELARAHIVTLSSGTTGAPTLWPRFPDQDAAQTAGFASVLQEHLRIRERWTLMVVNLAMGSWIAGTMLAEMGQRIFSQPETRGTVVTPGLNQDETLRFLEQLAPHYDQTVIFGYAAPMITLLEEGARRGIPWSNLNVTLLSGSEYVSDGQRERMAQLVGKDPDRLEGFVGLFASSEAGGVIGYESLLCLLIRRLCVRTPALAEALFDSTVVPSLNQYNPLNTFLESYQGEILLTTRGGVPLVRYNTHDRGGLLSLDEVLLRCRACGVDLPQELRGRGIPPEYFRPLPFVYVFGRSDAVTVHGANVYVDQIVDILTQPTLRASNTGHFRVATLDPPAGPTVLHLEVELSAGTATSEALRALYVHGIVRGLRRVNSEFRAAYDTAGGRIEMAVDLVPFGRLALKGAKHRYIVRDPTSLGTRPDAANGQHQAP